MQKITPFLWFDTNAEEAVNFYITLFPHSEITGTTRYGEAGPGPAGQVMTITFKLAGQDFIALNGGPEYKFNEAISFQVNCESQEEVDRLWSKLTSEGGEEVQCGWLKDRFGLSWQIIPTGMTELLQDTNPVKAQRVMVEMLKMKKIDLNKLQQAYDQG